MTSSLLLPLERGKLYLWHRTPSGDQTGAELQHFLPSVPSKRNYIQFYSEIRGNLRQKRLPPSLSRNAENKRSHEIRNINNGIYKSIKYDVSYYIPTMLIRPYQSNRLKG
jgi:hypothetical protein